MRHSNTKQIEQLQTKPDCTPGYSTQYSVQCAKCSKGETSDGGQSNCYCMAGTSSSFFSCAACDDGKYSTKGASSCTACSDGQLSDPLNQNCIQPDECDTSKGFTKSDSACKCAGTLSLDGTQCLQQCGSNEVAFDFADQRSYCGCSLNYIPDALNTSCIALDACSTSGEFKVENYKCVCSDENKVPVLNGSQIQCIPTPSQKCDKNQYLKDGACTPCPDNSTSPGGYVLQCTCNYGFNMTDGVCKAIQCSTTQYFYNNKCNDCPANSFSAGGLGTTCDCNPGFSFDKSQGQCVKCPDLQISKGGLDSTCFCAPGTQISGSSCSKCYGSSVSPGNATSCTSCSGDKNYSSPTFDSCISKEECGQIFGTVITTGFSPTCTCNGNSLSLKGDACVPVDQCGGNTTTAKYRDSTGGSFGTIDVLQCICQNGYVVHPLETSCILPSECLMGIGLTVKGYKCVCEETQQPPVRNDQGQYLCGTTPVEKKDTDCAENYYLKNFKCTECPEHSSSPGGNATVCECDRFYIKENNECTKVVCDANSYYNDNARICAQCPDGATSPGGNATECDCGSKATFENSECVALNTASPLSIWMASALILVLLACTAACIAACKRSKNRAIAGGPECALAI